MKLQEELTNTYKEKAFDASERLRLSAALTETQDSLLATQTQMKELQEALRASEARLVAKQEQVSTRHSMWQRSAAVCGHFEPWLLPHLAYCLRAVHAGIRFHLCARIV